MFWLLLGVLLIVVGLDGPLWKPSAPSPQAPASSTTQPVARIWVVRPGDTLWEIALAVTPAKQGEDLRPLVAELRAENGGKPLYVGERIRVP